MSEKRVALVTGSVSGIGAAVARRLAADGLRVVINSVRSADEGRDLARSLPDALYVRADIADEGEARGLVAAAVEVFGRLDLLVNNAGTTRRIPHTDLDAVTPAVWREILDVNLLGTWQVSVAAVRHLRATAQQAGTPGSIVNMSSVAGIRPAGSSIPYAVSKAAVVHLTRLMAAALGPWVRVNAVAPGLIDTPWTKDFTAIREKVEAITPLRRIGEPADVAAAVRALLDAHYTTGEVVLVDGGSHLVIG